MEHESIITIAPVGRDGLLAMSDDFSIHPLICRSGGSPYEQFRVEQRENGNVCLKYANFKACYMSAQPDGQVDTQRTEPFDWEYFTIMPLDGGKIALQSHHGGYLGVNPEDANEVRSDYPEIGPNNTFTVRKQGEDSGFYVVEDGTLDDGAVISLALVDGDARLGMSECYSGCRMRATMCHDADWEQFRVVHKDDGKVALALCVNSDLYMSAQEDGGIANNRRWATETEEWRVIPVEGGVTLQSHYGGFLGVNAENNEARADYTGEAPEAVFTINKQNGDGVFEPIVF